MAWEDIPTWKAMSKDELMELLKKEYENDPLLEIAKWIYVSNCYELRASIYSTKPTDCFYILWRKT